MNRLLFLSFISLVFYPGGSKVSCRFRNYVCYRLEVVFRCLWSVSSRGGHPVQHGLLKSKVCDQNDP